nr:A24 family peptidase [Aliikangiella sp. G2MR2-5]
MLGSFLNVVIYRYPVMLYREWESMAKDVLSERGFTISPEKSPIDKDPETYTIVTPRSSCRNCGHKITALENIPVLSYLALGGKCRGCKTPISIRYPMIEALTGAIFGLCAWKFGYGLELLVSLIISAYFVSMSMIDIDHQILPDNMTLPLVWLALIAGLDDLFIPLEQAVIGAISGYLALWTVYWLFKLLTGKEGMGHGDFKLLAAIGALVGWQKLGLVIILSAGAGALIGGGMMILQNKSSQTKIPFGPYLAIAGWITLLWGDYLLDQYLQFAGLK